MNSIVRIVNSSFETSTNGALDVEPKHLKKTNAMTLPLGYYVYFSSEARGETVLHQVLTSGAYTALGVYFR